MAGQPIIAGNAPPSELAMLLQGYSPQTAVNEQRSQYLAQALAQMGQQSQNIRTPVALGSDLLAQALLQRKYGQSMQDFAQSARADQQQIAAPYEAWLGQQGGAQAPPAAPGPAPSPATAPAVSPAAPAAAPPAAPAASPPPSPIVLRAVLGEAGGDPQGQRAVYSAILKRAQESGLTPEQVVTAPGQFEGLNAPWMAKVGDLTPYLQKTAANIAGDAPGQFDSFYSPKAQAALGRPAPTWANGPGVNIGGNSFYETGYQAPAGLTPSRAQTASGAPAYAPQGQPGPLQITPNPQGTPTPSPSPSQPPAASAPPAPAGATASAAPATASPVAGAASAPGLYHQPVAPEEIALARQLLSSPRTYQQGLAYVEQLRERTAAPVKPEASVSREGQVISYNPYDPSSASATSVPGWRPPLPAGWTWGPDGKAVPTAAVQYGAPHVIQGTNTIGQVGPGGKLEAGPQMEFGPQQRADLQSKFYSSPEFEKFAEARAALNGFRNAVAQMRSLNNGVLDTAAVDSYLRGINPNASARQTTVEMFLGHLGLPQELQGAVLSATGNGYVTPQTLQQMDQVMQSYTAAHAGEVQAIHQGHVALAKQYGVDEAGLGENIGDIPGPMTLNFGTPSAAQAGASAAQTAQTASTSLANAARNLPRLSPQDAAKLPRGTHFLGLDGRERVRQ